MARFLYLATTVVVSSVLFGCGSSDANQSIASYALRARVGGRSEVVNSAEPLHAIAGDVVELDVVGVTADGSDVQLPSTTGVEWSGVPIVTVATDDGAEPPMSAVTDGDDDVVIRNAARFGASDDGAVMGIIKSGTGSTEVRAVLSGVEPGETLEARVAASDEGAGNGTRGKPIYLSNCASCHGPAGEGVGDAPGLNAAQGNVAADPAWSGALFAVAARVGMDNDGMALAATMPTWLTTKAANGQLLTTQDFADMYAFLQTQGR
jgi:mono/diheme cytochrome c family protein